MTSPARISCRERLSSNSAAKLFSLMAEAGIWDSVFMSKGLELAEKPFHLTGWFIFPSAAEKTLSCGLDAVGMWVIRSAGWGPARRRFEPLEYPGNDLLYRKP